MCAGAKHLLQLCGTNDRQLLIYAINYALSTYR